MEDVVREQNQGKRIRATTNENVRSKYELSLASSSSTAVFKFTFTGFYFSLGEQQTRVGMSLQSGRPPLLKTKFLPVPLICREMGPLVCEGSYGIPQPYCAICKFLESLTVKPLEVLYR